MTDANLLATLARLSLNAAFVIAAVIWHYKQQCEVSQGDDDHTQYIGNHQMPVVYYNV